MIRHAGMTLAALAAAVVAAFVAAGTSRPAGDGGPVVRPAAKVQTDPVPSDGDAADDPAIWIHPTKPAESIILGTDKRGALHAYDMTGKRRQTVGRGTGPNNVDVLYDFTLGGRRVDLAVATVRSGRAGVKAWRIDPASGRLVDVTAGGVLAVLGRQTSYGLCTYRSAKTGKGYFFVTGRRDQAEQYFLSDDGAGRVSAKKVRTLKIASTAEGCVADDEAGFVYIAEEAVGIWKFPAEPDARGKGQLIARVGAHGLTADVEGLAIYAARGGKGYLIASSQGSNTFKVYDRRAPHRFVLTIDPAAGRIDNVSDTDGIAVTNRPTSKALPAGFLVVQDGHNSGGRQNFKIYDWRDIAGKRLIVDPQADPRRRPRTRPAPPARERAARNGERR